MDESDLQSEGIGVKYGGANLFILATTWIDESKGGNDILLLGVDEVFSVPTAGQANSQPAWATTQYTGFDRPTDSPFDSTGKLVRQDIAGNRLTADGRYVSDFELIEAFAELKFPVGFGQSNKLSC